MIKALRKKMKPKLNIVLRGHVRSSLNDRILHGLVSKISDLFDTKLYVHTWDIVQNSLSWRGLIEVTNQVSHEDIKEYFSGMDVNWIKVESDKNLKHVGKTEGFIGFTRCPVLGWKNMYWGIHSGVEAVYRQEPADSVTVQMRMDVLSNPYSPSENEVLEFLVRDHEVATKGDMWERIRFLRMHCFMGVDNIYMARTVDLMRFVSYIYNDMDRILEVHRGTINQEHIAFHERQSFFNWVMPGESVDGVPVGQEGA